MTKLSDFLTFASSTTLRISAYIFLRWIPGHQLPALVYTSFILYVPVFLDSFFKSQNSYSNNLPNATNKSHKNTAKPSSNVDINIDNLKNNFNGETKIPSERWLIKLWRCALGLPSPRSTLLSVTTFTINFFLVLGVVDLVYRARYLYPVEDLSFARIGYISPTEAKLVIREPDVSKLPIYTYYRPVRYSVSSDNHFWKTADIITSLTNRTDYTGTVTLTISNSPEQIYQWKTSTNHTGFLKTPPNPGNVSDNGEFTFLMSSCIKARFPYNPLTHALAIPGFKHMSSVLKKFSKSQFMLFLGDFIYIDVPIRFGTTVEDYRREYRQVYASPDWPLVSQNLSWIHVLDDHEIANDWDRRKTGLYNAAVDPWHHYQTAVNPPSPRNTTGSEGTTYFEFTQGPASFFMLDTRTYRDQSNELPVNATEKTMLGTNQLIDLLAFLKKPEVDGVRWKFVISSVPFTKNWRVNALDTWAGYLHERHVILKAMWDVSLQSDVRVVILSGDRHEFASTAFPPPIGEKWPSSASVHEFSVGPLSQFYLPVPTYIQLDNEDVKIKYISTGNSKLGVFTIKRALSGDQSELHFRLYIDGQEAWSYMLLAPPVADGLGHTKAHENNSKVNKISTSKPE